MLQNDSVEYLHLIYNLILNELPFVTSL